MSRFDPKKLRLIDCELVAREYGTHPQIRDHSTAKRVEHAIAQNIWPYLEGRALYVWVKVECEALIMDQFILAMDVCVFRAIYEFENFDDIVIEQPGKDTPGELDTNAVIACLSIALSTARGQLQSLQAATAFVGSLLPVFPVQEIATLPRFEIGDFVPTWFELPKTLEAD